MMNTKIFLVLGLIYAGAAAGEPNGTSKRSDDGKNLQLQSMYGHVPYPECNYCIKNVVILLKKAIQVKEEDGTNFFSTPKACELPEVEKRICLNLIGTLQKLNILSILQARKLCVSARYCPTKNSQVTYSRDGPLGDILWQKRQNEGQKPPKAGGKMSCKISKSKPLDIKTVTKRPDSHGGTPQDVTPSNNDSLPRDASACNNCQIIMTMAKEVAKHKKELLPSYLPFLCTELDGKLRDYCLNLVYLKGYEIIRLLVEGMSPNYICKVLKQCYEPQPLCRACSNYVGQIYTLYYSSEIEACSYLPTEMSKQCVTKLKQHKKQIYHYADNNIPGSQICRTLQYCDEAVNPPTKNIINFNTVSESSYDSYDEAWAGFQNDFN